jgi:hypothetical protein
MNSLDAWRVQGGVGGEERRRGDISESQAFKQA